MNNLPDADAFDIPSVLPTDSDSLSELLDRLHDYFSELDDAGQTYAADSLWVRIQDVEDAYADACAREDDAWGYARGPRYDGQAGRRYP